jgi:AmmeMemoRadiSam system protein B/AmmeMemoRadiSam system protein A
MMGTKFRILTTAVVCAVACCCDSPDQSQPAPGTVQRDKPARKPRQKKVLDSKLAGTWYPESEDDLGRMIDTMLKQTEEKISPPVRALILPHAGYRYSGLVAAWGVRQAMKSKIDRVVVIGPSHRYPLGDAVSVPDHTHYSTPLGEVPLDTDMIDALMRSSCVVSVPDAHIDEHSVQIEIPILQRALGAFKLVPIVTGTLSMKNAEQLGKEILGLIDDRTLVVASTDFTHYGPNYGYVPFKTNVAKQLRELDMKVFGRVQEKKLGPYYDCLLKTGATVCGRCPVAVLMSMLKADSRVHLVKYDTSGRMTGNFTNSVSYVSAAIQGGLDLKSGIEIKGGGSKVQQITLSDKARKNLLKLARATLEYVFEKRKAPAVSDLDVEITDDMKHPMGAFVTLKKKGQLRGCIGEYPRRAIYLAVMEMALASAFRDTRFKQLKKEELADLTIEISALYPYKTVSSCKDIVLGKHGIIIEKKGRRAVYLPQVATEQGWDLDQTLSHLSRKAGLEADAWKEGATFRVFEAEVFHEGGEE